MGLMVKSGQQTVLSKATEFVKRESVKCPKRAHPTQSTDSKCSPEALNRIKPGAVLVEISAMGADGNA